MNKSKLLIALVAMSSSVAFAGGTVHRAPMEAPAEVAPAPAPAPAPVEVAPAPVAAPVAVAPAFVPSWYVGASIGRTHYTDTVGAANATGGKVFAGYRFHPNFAAEVSYVNLGSTDGARGEGASADVLGILPVGYNTDLFAKVGVADLKLKSGAGDSGSKVGANYGIGATYHFNRNIGVRAEAERYEKVGDTGVKANQYSVGVQYNF